MDIETKKSIIEEAKALNLTCYRENGYEVFEVDCELDDEGRMSFCDSDERREEEYKAVEALAYGEDLTDEQVDLIEDVLIWASEERARRY